MMPYTNVDRVNGIVGYDIARDSITIRFSDGEEYVYTYASAGETNVEEMKVLAAWGYGLEDFLGTVLKKRYASKRHLRPGTV